MVRAAESVIVEKCAKSLGKAGNIPVIGKAFLVGLWPKSLK